MKISIMIFLFMVLDGFAPPIGLKSITAAVNGTELWMEGVFEPGNAVPLLIWPKSTQWFNPCSKSKDLCCLKDLNRNYRNDALKKVQGANCLTSLPNNLVTGSRENVVSTATMFQAKIPIDTPFVAMLFVHINPFFILDSYQQIKILPANQFTSTIVTANNPCYNVIIPKTLISVCMQCNNPLPRNAHFVWTPSWHNNFHCSWECNFNYLSVENQCESVENPIPLQTIIGIVAGCVICFLICIFVCLKRRSAHSHYFNYYRKLNEPVIQSEPIIRKEFITFKDNDISQDLRFKLL
jgi:hypothetical protein